MLRTREFSRFLPRLAPAPTSDLAARPARAGVCTPHRHEHAAGGDSRQCDSEARPREHGPSSGARRALQGSRPGAGERAAGRRSCRFFLNCCSGAGGTRVWDDLTVTSRVTPCRSGRLTGGSGVSSSRPLVIIVWEDGNRLGEHVPLRTPPNRPPVCSGCVSSSWRQQISSRLQRT
jgi:hypothetical protein